MKGEAINNYTGTSGIYQNFPKQTGVYSHPTQLPYDSLHILELIDISLLLLIYQSFLTGNVS